MVEIEESWNYGIWKSRIEDLLHMKDLLEPIKGEEFRLVKLDDKK